VGKETRSWGGLGNRNVKNREPEEVSLKKPGFWRRGPSGRSIINHFQRMGIREKTGRVEERRNSAYLIHVSFKE